MRAQKSRVVAAEIVAKSAEPERKFEIPALIGALYMRRPFQWRSEERVLERSTRASIGKARKCARAFRFDAERRIYMIKLLVELPLIGKFTIIIVWHRQGKR
jgi:hypothetical protein